ncbi:hypothetical protein ACUR5C_09705 [Aliikangiella sp. IMCC44653]
MRNCLLLLAIAFAFPAKAQIEPSKVDPSLAIVSQGFGFRVLVYYVCSPEHCWNETYLQSISFGEKKGHPQLFQKTSQDKFDDDASFY